MKSNSVQNKRIVSGVRNLDAALSGGIPAGSLVVFAGTPGSGKTILSQQIIFKNASPKKRGVFFQTLSEPTAKTLRYLQQFELFDRAKLEDGSVEFIDLGEIMRAKGLEEASALLTSHVKRIKPAFVVIDSFKVFEDLARSQNELRKFSYEVAIKLMAWECTTFLLGEFSRQDMQSNPLFSIVDGIITLSVREESGEQQRFIQIMKMRGTDHSRDENAFTITSAGLEIFTPRVTIQRKPEADRIVPGNGPYRAKVGIRDLDALLGAGIPYGSTLLISGVAGTGKTLLLLEFIYRGASEHGEKGILFSFEETKERLIASGTGMGWDIESQIKKGNIEIVFIPQPEIFVEKHLLMMKECIERMGAVRIAIDSASVFVHKIKDPQIVREKMFQLGTLVQMTQGIGFFSADIPYGSNTISRFGVEETVVDGIILLTAVENGLKRDRFLEVYKLRNTNHTSGKHRMDLKHDGITLETPSAKVATGGKKSVRKRTAVKR